MSSSEPSVFALILAGGAGSRFWPASRAHLPKQLLPLLGKGPLIVETLQRVLPLCGAADQVGRCEHVLIGSGKRLAEPTAAILKNFQGVDLLIEPVPRNTAPCIGWAAARVAARDPDAVLMVLPSDHHIGDVEGFRATVRTAVASAALGTITTIGIRPTHAETGYGYIEVARDLPAAAPGTIAVRRFVEKPDRARAEEFVASGNHLWNAGMFFFRAGDMMAEIRAHLPALAEGLDAMVRAEALGQVAGDETLARIFPTLPAVSIDHGVMEHVKRLAVVPGDFGWSDIGSWHSAWELADKDSGQNASPASTVLVDAHNNHVVDLRSATAQKRVIALVGVDDLVVVETDDALLVVPRSRCQEVRAVVDALKARGDVDLV